jgi:hypothetical protein
MQDSDRHKFNKVRDDQEGLLLRGLSLGNTVEYKLGFQNDELVVHIKGRTAAMTRR